MECEEDVQLEGVKCKRLTENQDGNNLRSQKRKLKAVKKIGQGAEDVSESQAGNSGARTKALTLSKKKSGLRVDYIA